MRVGRRSLPEAIFSRGCALLSTSLATALVLLALAPPDAAAQTFGAPAALNSNASTDSENDGGVSFAVDSDGNWVAVWASSENLGGSIGIDKDIFVARSADDGATWTAPAALNANAASDTGIDEAVTLASDGGLNLVAMWESSENLGGTIGTDQDVLVSRSSDGGLNWSAPQALNSNAASDTAADFVGALTTDEAGTWLAVWWTTDTLGGTVGSDQDIVYSRSLDGGASWSAMAALNNYAATDSSFDNNPSVTTDGAGNWIAVWNTTENLGGSIGTDADIVFARSFDGGVGWTATAALNSNAGSDAGGDFRARIVEGGNGTWIAAWRSDENLGGTVGFDHDILFARSTDVGVSWSTVAALNANATTDAGADDNPRLASDSEDLWIVLWDSTDTLGGTIGTDKDILTARSTDDGLSWTAASTMDPGATSDSDTNVGQQIATDRLGHWLAGWLSPIGLDFDIVRSTAFGPDTDGDGLADPGETFYGTNPMDTDSDDDGLTDGAEVNTWGTNPLVTDSDGDGLSDGDEVNTHGTDPATADSDSDGLDDGDEVITHSTDPLDLDTDDDGISDGDEINTHATDPLDADSDDDGFDDGNEVIAGSDPNDAASVLVAFAAYGVLDGDADLDFGPRVAVDYSGNWISEWDGGGSGSWFARSTDGGSNWSAPTLLPSGSGARGPDMATDGSSWVSVYDLPFDCPLVCDRDIRALRSTDGGASWLGSNAVQARNVFIPDIDARVATDGQGNWLALWDRQGGVIRSMSRSTDAGLNWAELSGEPSFATRLAADGLGTWIALGPVSDDVHYSRSFDAGDSWTSGVPLNTNAATDTGSDILAQITTDGAGTWLAVWQSDENLLGAIGTDLDILYARSTDAGATWSPPAALNSNAAADSGADTRPQVTTDGAGSWVAIWESTENLGGLLGADKDVFHVLSTDGGLTWTSPTALNTNAALDAEDDETPQLATDEAGRWVAVWEVNADIHFATGTGPDRDGDGLTGGEEGNIHGTDALNPDTDGDGLPDGDEVNTHLTDPLDVDTDGDGFSDGDEITAGTDPLDPNDPPPPGVPVLGATGFAVLALLLLLVGMLFRARSRSAAPIARP